MQAKTELLMRAAILGILILGMTQPKLLAESSDEKTLKMNEDTLLSAQTSSQGINSVYTPEEVVVGGTSQGTAEPTQPQENTDTNQPEPTPYEMAGATEAAPAGDVPSSGGEPSGPTSPGETGEPATPIT